VDSVQLGKETLLVDEWWIKIDYTLVFTILFMMFLEKQI